MDQLIKMIKFQPEDGTIDFRGNRMLLFNANALCLLREELIHTLGTEIARGVLTRFGYRCGFNDVISVRNMFNIKTDAEWMMAGTQMHSLEGSVKVIADGLEYDREAGTFHMYGKWLNTYEADQHLALFGQVDEAICWTIAGYASGFGSGFMGREVLCIETMCRGKGDPYCAWDMRNIEAWGEQAGRYLSELKPVAVVKSLEKMLADERRMLEQWRALSEASVEITSDIASGRRLRSFASYARNLMFAEHSLIAIKNENSPGFEVFRTCADREWKRDTYDPKGVLASLVQKGTPINLSDIKNEHHLPSNVANMLGVPLIARSEIIGGLIVANKKDGTPFSQNDLELLQILAGQAAVAIENSRLFERTDEKLQQKVAQLNQVNTILSAQNDMVKKSAAIHSELTELVLEGKGIDVITASLAQIVSNPIIVEDASFKRLSYAGLQPGQGEEMLFDTGEDEEIHFISARDIMNKPEWDAERLILNDERRIAKILLRRSAGKELYQYLVPVAAGRDILGYVSCLGNHRKLEAVDMTALEHAGTVYALELLKQKVAFETEQRIKEDFLGELLSATYKSEEQVIQQAAKLGFNLTNGYLVTILDVTSKEPEVEDAELLNRLLEPVSQEVRAYSPASIVMNKNKQILILLALTKKVHYLDSFDKFAQHLKNGVLKKVQDLIWRLAAGTACHNVPDFRCSHENAVFTLEVMNSINRQNNFMAYDRLRIFGMLDINKKSFTDFINKVIGPLLDYDAEYNSQLVETLDLYYRNNGNVQQAARTGYLNPSTLKYRLKRIQEIARIDLADPDTSLQVQLALKLLT